MASVGSCCHAVIDEADFASLIEFKLADDRDVLYARLLITRLIEEVVCGFTLAPTFNLVANSVIAHMMELNSTTSLSVVTFGEASLECGSLFAHNESLDRVRYRLLRHLAVKAVAHITILILARVDELTVVLVAGYHGRLVKVIVIDNDHHFHQLCLPHG